MYRIYKPGLGGGGGPGEWQRSLDLLSELPRQRIQPTTLTYNAVMTVSWSVLRSLGSLGMQCRAHSCLEGQGRGLSKKVQGGGDKWGLQHGLYGACDLF